MGNRGWQGSGLCFRIPKLFFLFSVFSVGRQRKPVELSGDSDRKSSQHMGVA